MRRMDLWKLSLLNVFASPVRSVLTVLGMAIGVSAILAVLALGEAGKTQVRAEMGRLGIDKVWVSASGEDGLRHGDGRLLADILALDATEVAYASASVKHGSEAVPCAVLGCAQSYLDMTGIALAKGRALYPMEWRADSRSVLLGESAAQAIGARPGDVITLEGIAFVVRGTVQSANAFSRVDASGAVIVPIEALCVLLGQTVHEVLLDVPEGTMPQNVATMAQNVMEMRRGVSVDTLTLQVQMEAADSVITIFVDVLKWVALICILVGGIGVMNILLVSVRERRREIGVMKSLGTTYGQICALFLLEAVLYATLGGVLGILLGFGLIAAAGRSIGLTAWARPADCVTVFLAALAVGIAFGVMPASRAASLKCVDALRDE